MRVIAGRYRGRRLQSPTGLNTRPILDRVKVPLFDWLCSRLDEPGSLPPLNVLDLFCGGGGLGIETLSRGAAFCAFVEADRAAFRCLRENVERLEIGPAARVYNCHAEAALVAPPTGAPFELVFLDPPYRLSEDVAAESTVGRILANLGGRISVAPTALVMWRHAASSILPDPLPGDWSASQRRCWGKMAITMLERRL